MSALDLGDIAIEADGPRAAEGLGALRSGSRGSRGSLGSKGSRSHLLTVTIEESSGDATRQASVPTRRRSIEQLSRQLSSRLGRALSNPRRSSDAAHRSFEAEAAHAKRTPSRSPSKWLRGLAPRLAKGPSKGGASALGDEGSGGSSPSLLKLRKAIRGAITVSRLTRTHELATRIAGILAQMSRSEGGDEGGLTLAEWCQGSLSQPLILHAFSAIAESAQLHLDVVDTPVPTLQQWTSQVQQASHERSENSVASLSDDDDDEHEGNTPRPRHV